MAQNEISLLPADITVDNPDAEVRILWRDGQVSVYAFDKLRAACPCAECKAHKQDDNPLRQAMLVSVELESAELVGNYALQLVWRDGHRFGIYSWAYLRSLG
jgi:DUF971 family protein